MTSTEVFAFRHSFRRPVALASVLWIFTFGCRNANEEDFSTRSQLRPASLEPLPLGSIRPTGWLRRQLEIQAKGLTGHLDEFWPDIQESGWIGGKAEGWERMPYWLDGLVPLAYMLEDPGLVEKSEAYLDYVLTHQAADGWLGPEKSPEEKYRERDPWPVFVMMKVFTQYFEVSRDERVVPALRRFLAALDRQLGERPLFDWNRMRWQDGVLSVYWLYERDPEPWLLDLARKMRNQGYDWTAHFEDLPHKDRVERWDHESHVVNNAMGVKAPAVWFRQSGLGRDRQTALTSLQTLDRYHGQASGIFSGDECFAGKMPSQGTETCAVVEYLYSLEVLAAIFGEPAIGDRLEKIAFNALPAPFKPDMWARQYVQQANQPQATVSEEHIYTTNGSQANIFGLEANYGCCTANMHQGWPKFVSHSWMKSADQGLAAVVYAPSSVKTRIGGANIQIDLVTEYPFHEELEFTVRADQPVRFPLRLRIPEWCPEPGLQVGGNPLPQPAPGQFAELLREWDGETVVRLYLPMPVKIERRFNGAVSVSRGPLVFSLRIGEEWRHLMGEMPHADWEVWPTTPWNFALDIDAEKPEESIEFQFRKMGDNPFSLEGTPVLALVKGRRLPEWKLEKNAAAPPPPSPVHSNEPLEELTLVPYGSAKLRITEFPSLR